jgi:hypothetical protein
MRSLAMLISGFALMSCSRGIYLTKNVYRPKRPNYSIIKLGLRPNDLIDSKHLYVSTKKFANYDGKFIIGYMGFYSDGRLIVDNFITQNGRQTGAINNSYENAGFAGYYTCQDRQLALEYFVPTDGGQYIRKEGIVRKDTVIIVETLRTLPFHSEKRYDTLVRSSFDLL